MKEIYIVDGYRGHHGQTYILPVKNICTSSLKHPYDGNWDKVVGVFDDDFAHYLFELLNKYIDPLIQFFGNPVGRFPDYYDGYGWNFYSKESFQKIIDDLHDFISDEAKLEEMRKSIEERAERYLKRTGKKLDVEEEMETKLEYHKILVRKFEEILQAAEDYEYILFFGP